jgi:periplasmic divalent cation tolerance protein
MSVTAAIPPAERRPADSAWVVLVTVPEAGADRLARTLVEEGRAACVNCGPTVRSIYRWRGKVDEALEVLLIIKTTAAGFPPLERRIRELRPYDVPEVLALPVAAGSARYLDWLAGAVTPA